MPYIKIDREEFYKQRQDFQIYGLLFSHHIKSDWIYPYTTILDVDLFFLSGGIVTI